MKRRSWLVLLWLRSIAAGRAGAPFCPATAASPPAPQPARALAPIVDVAGYWVSVVTEDWRWRDGHAAERRLYELCRSTPRDDVPPISGILCERRCQRQSVQGIWYWRHHPAAGPDADITPGRTTRHVEDRVRRRAPRRVAPLLRQVETGERRKDGQGYSAAEWEGPRWRTRVCRENGRWSRRRSDCCHVRNWPVVVSERAWWQDAGRRRIRAARRATRSGIRRHSTAELSRWRQRISARAICGRTGCPTARPPSNHGILSVAASPHPNGDAC